MATLITVESFTDPLDAHLAKGRLEAEGIQAYIAHENHIWANWMLSTALGGVKLQVFETDLDKARKIIKEHLNGDFENTLNQEFTDIEINACPKCGSTEFVNSASFFSKLLLFLTFGFFSVIYKISKDNHQCGNCGHKWKE